MAEETKPIEENTEAEAAVTAGAETPAPATDEKAPVAPEKTGAEEKAPAEAPKDEAPKREKRKDIFAAIEGDDAEEAKPKRKIKGAKNVPYGIAFIKTTFNNTIVSLTDMRGQVVSWSSAGRCGFKGSRKSTAFAATTVAQEAARGAISHGMNEVEVRVQGPGAGRESAVRAIQAAGLRVSAIKDATPVPHNGCRQKKQRRV
jgi:small subunit ribosomal protein S11